MRLMLMEDKEQLKKSFVIEERRRCALENDMDREIKKRRMKVLSLILLRNYDLKTCEMYPFDNEEGVIKSNFQTPQYSHEIGFHNTRTKTLPETRAEIDNLSFDEAVDLICEICLRLIELRIHFVVFYAEEQRSPHVIIYDFEQLRDLTAFQRFNKQLQFWRKVIPFSVHKLDMAVWMDDHLLPIEFGMHYKYQTPFKLLFEFNPFPKKSLQEEYEELIREKIDYASKRKDGWKPKGDLFFYEINETREEKHKKYKQSRKRLLCYQQEAQLTNLRKHLKFMEEFGNATTTY